MHPIDKTPFWAWPLGIVGCSGPVIFYLIVHEMYAGAALVGAAVFYGAGLGRALLRRRLVAQGIPLNDQPPAQEVSPRYRIVTLDGSTVWATPMKDPESGLDWIALWQEHEHQMFVAHVGPGDFAPTQRDVPPAG